MFDQDTQPGLLEVHGTPATSEEDVQLAAMGWTIPRTCRPHLPATPKQLAPATAAVAAGGLPVPAEVPQKTGVLPATVVPSHANGMPAPATVPHHQVGSGQGSGVRAPATPQQVGNGQTGGLPAPATVPQQSGQTGGVPATVPQQVGSGLQTGGLPAPATVPQQSGQTGGVPATVPQQVGSGLQTGGLPAPATVPQQVGQTGGVPATVPQQVGSGLQTGGLPAPATVPQQVGSGQTGAPAAVPQQSGHGLVPPPATLPQQVGNDGQAGGLPAPATVPQQVGSGEIGGVPAPATAVPKQAPATVVPMQAPATVVPKQAPATGGLAAPATASSPGVSHEAQQAKAALPPAPALLQPHQVYHAPTTHVVPKVAMMPPPRVVPQQAQVGFAAPATYAAKSGMPAQPNKEEYSRRAAANLIKRLKDNPGRVEGMPSLKNMLHDESKKSELISLIVDNQGNLANVQAFLQVQEEVGKVQIARKKALRYTKKQMQDAYGEDAEAVMKFKEEQGLIDDDENNPNGKVYLIAAREDETENYHRNSCLDACLMKKMHDPNQALKRFK